jgi:anti-anti-sigma factor
MPTIGDVNVLCDKDGSECRVSLSGRITIDSSPDLRVLLLDRLRSPESRQLTLDFDGVPQMDTSGLAILLETLRAARTEGKSLHLLRLHEQPRFLLEVTHVLHFFEEVKAS